MKYRSFSSGEGEGGWDQTINYKLSNGRRKKEFI